MKIKSITKVELIMIGKAKVNNIKSTTRMISKISIVILGLLMCLGVSQLCPNPQKSFYMSYKAISDHDYLSVMFQNVSQVLPQYNLTYTDKNGSIYSIFNFRPHLYYNEHRQVEQYHDQYSVKVTLGQLFMSYHFDIIMKHENLNVTGWARGRTLVDQYQFLKKITMIDGAIEWDPVYIRDLDINSPFSIEFSDPKLTQYQTSIYIQLLNDYIGDVRIKENSIKSMNTLVKQKLKYHLNHEPLLKNSSIVYKYNNITLNYANVIRDFSMNNNQTKGLEVFLQFGFQDGNQSCSQIPKEFDEESYGGVQEIYSMGMVKTTIQRAVAAGLFNMQLDKRNEVPYFQFFMGDLGNFVDYANKLPAHDPFTITCQFAQDRANELKTVRFDEHDLYVQVPQDCTIGYKGAPVLKVSFDMNLVIRLTAQNDAITSTITSVGVFGDKYISIDSKFVVTDLYVARYALTAVLKGFVGKNVFGTGFPIFTRKYPVLRILDDYIVIFDPSEK